MIIDLNILLFYHDIGGSSKYEELNKIEEFRQNLVIMY